MVVRQLSSCINEKYNGFQIISIEYSDKLTKKIWPIDIIYKPVKSIDEKILCNYSTDLSKAYRNSCGESAEKISLGFAFKCCYCRNFLLKQTDENVILKAAAEFLGSYIILIIKTWLLLNTILSLRETHLLLNILILRLQHPQIIISIQNKRKWLLYLTL